MNSTKIYARGPILVVYTTNIQVKFWFTMLPQQQMKQFLISPITPMDLWRLFEDDAYMKCRMFPWFIDMGRQVLALISAYT